MLIKCCTQYTSKFGKLRGLEKVSLHSNPKERQCQRKFKLPYNVLISHASKIMLKILQVRLQQYVNQELPDVYKLGLKKQKNEIKLDHGKQGSSRKTSASLTTSKPLIVLLTRKCEKSLRIWEYYTILPVS